MSLDAAKTWWVLRSGPGEPGENMATDELLLQTAGVRAAPLLRFYSWTRAAASFGYTQRIQDVEGSTPLRPLVRRPTAGGIVPHQGDWTYSLTVPVSHQWWALKARESYRRLHLWIQESLAGLGMRTELAGEARKLDPLHCFAGPDPLDVLELGGGKIAGAAQRRNKFGLLIQGSLQVRAGLDQSRWEQAMMDAAQRQWGIRLQEWSPPSDWATRVKLLAKQKYDDASYLRRR